MGAEPPPGSTKTNLHEGVLPGRLVCGDEGRGVPPTLFEHPAIVRLNPKARAREDLAESLLRLIKHFFTDWGKLPYK